MDEQDKDMELFAAACKEYLSTHGLSVLRAYGRSVGVSNPTKKEKEELVELTVGILTGKLSPRAPSRRGAPVKNNFVDPSVVNAIEALRRMHLHLPEPEEPEVSEATPPQTFDFQAELKKLRENPFALELHDPAYEAVGEGWTDVAGICRGQIQTLEGVPCLLPLYGEKQETLTVLLVELIRRHDLREGDIVSYHAKEKDGVRAATEILTVNDVVIGPQGYLKRARFEACAAAYPSERLRLFQKEKSESTAAKYLQWILPILKGQRGCILSAPKAGKTELLFAVARAALKTADARVIVSLVGQAPEVVGKFKRAFGEEAVVATTYEQDPDSQVFAAEFALNRAKRWAESGKDALLLTDSLNALAHAYNDTQASAGGKALAGGLESKTLQYLKRYFGSARKLEGAGTLTVLGTLSVDTGNPADELIAAEMKSLSGAAVALDETLAMRRVYPAIDLINSRGELEQTASGREAELVAYLKLQYAPKYGNEKVLSLLAQSESHEAFENALVNGKA